MDKNHVKRVEARAGAQSRQFMIDILPFVRSYLETFKFGTRFRVLDVGVGSGYGTELLAALYSGSILGYTLEVYGLDLREDYHEFCVSNHRHFKHLVGDVFDDKFLGFCDIVICSHVVEHVPHPISFIRRLKSVGTKVFLAAPFEEPRQALTRGHINIIDRRILSEAGVEEFALIESPAWGFCMSPRYKMVVAEY